MHYVFNYVMNSALRQSGTQRCMKSSICVYVSGLNQNLPVTSGDMKALIKRVRSFVLIMQRNYILIQEDPIRAETMNSRWGYDDTALNRIYSSSLKTSSVCFLLRADVISVFFSPWHWRGSWGCSPLQSARKSRTSRV